MALLIDGYNLLHVTGLFGSTFEASRAALLNFLAAALDTDERSGTTIVFDAAEAPPGLPSEYTVAGIQVYYARGYDSADALLEELIAAHHTPKKLTVVSSDRRVQRAAKKRKALAVESHAWYHQAADRLQGRRKGRPDLPDVKPDVPLTPGEVAVWMRVFGASEFVEELPGQELLVGPTLSEPSKTPVTRPRKRDGTKRAPRAKSVEPRPTRKATRIKKPTVARPPRKSGKPKNLGFGDIKNPFPPGYGEDLQE